MSFLVGKQPQATQTPALTGVQVQTSAYGLCRTLAFGLCRIAGNLIWYGDFRVVQQSQSGHAGKGGGGGGGGKGRGGTTYLYYASFMLGLCEGPIPGIINMWNNKDLLPFTQSGFTLFTGSVGQAPWGYLSTYHPDQALGYSGLACVAISNFQLDGNAQIPNFGFEVNCGSNVPGQYDADPADIVRVLLADARNGCGFPSAYVSDLSGYSNYCRSANFLLSPAYTSQQSAAAIIRNIAALTNSEIVYSPGKLDLVPYGDAALSGNGAIWSPISAPLYDLTDDDFLDAGQPVKLTRVRPADACNSITLEFLNRANQYNTETAQVFDLNRIDLYGARPASVQQAHEFCDRGMALHSAQLLLQRQYVMNTYEFTVGWRYIVLDQMDIVTITDSALGLNRQWVRIKDIEEDNDGKLKITAEEVLTGTGAAALYSWSNPNGYYADYTVDPGNANAPVIFETPYQLNQDFEIWGAVSGGPNWGGCDVYASTDNKTYKKVGQIWGSARTGRLTSTLPALSTTSTTPPWIDSADTLAVDLTESRGGLNSGSRQDMLLGNTLCWCDGEFLSYQSATLTSPNQYNLTTLNRGMYGSAISSHASGKQFARLDNAIFKLSVDPALAGQTLYLKFVGWNLYQRGNQDMSSVPAYQYVIQGTAFLEPLADVTDLNWNYVAGLARLTWSPISDFRSPIDYEVRQGASWGSGVFLGRTPSTAFPFFGDGMYWVAAHFRAPNGIEVYSTDPEGIEIIGGMLTQNVVASYDEQVSGWLGTFDPSWLITWTNEILNCQDILSLNVFPAYLWLRPGWVGAAPVYGAYSIPDSHRVDIGRVASCNVLINVSLGWASTLYSVLNMPDILAFPDLFFNTLQAQIGMIVQVRTAGADGVYGAWQNYVPGAYVGQYFDARVVLSTMYNTLSPILESFTFLVDVPDREDVGTNAAILAPGSAITYASPFNAVPNVQITILNAQAGDDVILTNQTATGFTVQIVNSGAGVARSINWRAKGY